MAVGAGDKDANLIRSLSKAIIAALPGKTILCPYMQRPDKVSMSGVTQWIEVEIPSTPKHEYHGVVQVACRVLLDRPSATNAPAIDAVILRDEVVAALNAGEHTLYDCSDPSNPVAISGYSFCLRIKDKTSRLTELTHDEIIRYSLICWQPGVVR